MGKKGSAGEYDRCFYAVASAANNRRCEPFGSGGPDLARSSWQCGLGTLYIGLILALSALAGAISGQAAEKPVVLVLSTLIIATLFRPLRTRIQALIDRCFYRQKYDAEKALAAFRTTSHNAVDLEHIQKHLLAVVQETMQPTSLSLWVLSRKQHAFEKEIRAEDLSREEDRFGVEHSSS